MPTQRERLGAFSKRNRAEYNKSILHRPTASFQRFISKGIVTDSLGQVVKGGAGHVEAGGAGFADFPLR